MGSVAGALMRALFKVGNETLAPFAATLVEIVAIPESFSEILVNRLQKFDAKVLEPLVPRLAAFFESARAETAVSAMVRLLDELPEQTVAPHCERIALRPQQFELP